MRLKIMTILGEFTVILSYQPTGEDPTLFNFTSCINNVALNKLQKGKTPEEVLKSLNEASLEKELFNCLKVPAGAGPRVTLDLKNKEIQVHSF